MRDVQQCVQWANELVPSKSLDSWLVLSTGVIGQRLPMDRIQAAMQGAVKEQWQQVAGETSGVGDWEALSRAFMTTDTFPKLRVQVNHLPTLNISYRMVGIVKGYVL